MLLGIYKSFEELEENLTIEELNLILKADAQKEDRNHRFFAAINGIPWGGGEKGQETGEEAMERIRKEAEAALAGKSVEEIDLEAAGIKFVE